MVGKTLLLIHAMILGLNADIFGFSASAFWGKKDTS